MRGCGRPRAGRAWGQARARFRPAPPDRKDDEEATMTEDQALDRIREIVYGQPIGSRVSTGWMTGLQRKHVRTVEEVRDREDGLRRDAIRRAGLDPDEGFGPEVAQSAPIDLLADSTEEMVQAVRDYVWNEFGVALMPEVRP